MHTKWAITADHLPKLEAAYKQQLADPLAAAATVAAYGAKDKTRKAQGIAIVEVSGIIEPKPSFFGAMFGGTALNGLSSTLRTLAATPEISTVVLLFDSPGGGTYGVQEMAAEIFALRSKKRVLAHAQHMACSAAFWLACACSRFTIEPSGDTGSLGVYTMHVDESKALDAIGIKVTFIASHPHKVEQSSTMPLSDDALAYAQADIDSAYRTFLNDVARFRKKSVQSVEQTFGKGRILNAKQALACGAVDEICTFESLMNGPYDNQRRATARTNELRRAQQQRKRESAELLGDKLSGYDGWLHHDDQYADDE